MSRRERETRRTNATRRGRLSGFSLDQHHLLALQDRRGTDMSTRETIDLLAETNVSSAEYRLLELPPEIAALLERADESSQAAKTSKKRKLDTSHGIDDEGDQNGEEWEWNNRRKV